MATQTSITDTQKKTLKTIVATGRTPMSDVDGRSVNALEKRGLAKKVENKNGVFATATAKGKKLLN